MYHSKNNNKVMCCGEKRKALAGNIVEENKVYFKYKKSVATTIAGRNGVVYYFSFDGDIQPVLKEDAGLLQRFWYLEEVAKPN